MVHLCSVHCLEWLPGALILSPFPLAVVLESAGGASEVELHTVLASGPLGFGNQNPANRGRPAVQLGLCGAELTPPPGPASGGPWAAELRWRSSSGVPAGWRPGSARLYRKRADGSTPQCEAEPVPVHRLQTKMALSGRDTRSCRRFLSCDLIGNFFFVRCSISALHLPFINFLHIHQSVREELTACYNIIFFSMLFFSRNQRQ